MTGAERLRPSPMTEIEQLNKQLDKANRQMWAALNAEWYETEGNKRDARKEEAYQAGD